MVSGESQRSIPTPFLIKTYNLVEDPSINDVISWNKDGSSFIVWNTTDFAKDLLPKHFKHNNFSSFIRQLNTYGFKKVVPDHWEFSNGYFRRGEKHLLSEIQRRKITHQAVAPPVVVSLSNSGEDQVMSPSSSWYCQREDGGLSFELLEENEKLRFQNIQLNRELTQMKSLCDNIFSLMSNYAGSQTDRSCFPGGSRSYDAMRSVKFLSAKRLEVEEEADPRLFGVPIGLKRTRNKGGQVKSVLGAAVRDRSDDGSGGGEKKGMQ